MPQNVPTLTAPGAWTDLLQPANRAALEAILPAYIYPRRWFGAKAQQIVGAHIVEAIVLPIASAVAYLTLVRLNYASGGEDTYVLPLAYLPRERAESLLIELPHAAIAQLATSDGDGVLFDALFDASFCAALLDLIAQERSLVGEAGTLHARPTEAFERLRGQPSEMLTPKVGTAEQSNTSIIYGGRLIMKVFRKFEPGINPDLEIGRFLTDHSDFSHVPPAAGTIEYQRADSEPAGLAFLQGFVANQGDAWSYTLRAIARSFDHVLSAQLGSPDEQTGSLLGLADADLPAQARDVIDDYLAAAALLGRRTAELHIALASNGSDPDFAPEPFDEPFRLATLASMRGRAERAFNLLQVRVDDLQDELPQLGHHLLDQKEAILLRLETALGHPIAAVRTRIHGDYHLGQVLAADDDFFIIDFEGEPARPLRERRVKSSPLQDVAGMLRSFHYAPYAALLGQAPGASFSSEDMRVLEPWARFWQRWVSAIFLRNYLDTAGRAPFIPSSRAELQALLDAYLLDKALYELAYELNNRPTWVRIPLEGVGQLVS